MTGSARQDGRLLARLNSLSPSSDAHPAPLTCFSDQELDRRARTGSPARDAIGPMLAGSDPSRNCGSIRLRSEEHTSELQSLMRISYAVFCLKKKKKYNKHNHI